MKIKRQKRVNRILNFFKNNFGHHDPYNMLLDGTFCHGCLITKINIKEQMPKYFGGDVKLLTTACCILETEKLGPSLNGAAMILKQFAIHKCGHEDQPKPAMKCLKSMLGTNNLNRYFIATQDPELRQKARKIPGTPILYLHGTTPTLEDPSTASCESASKSANDRMEGTSYQTKILNDLKLKTFGDQNNAPRKKKGKKGPNPLSCLKSKKKSRIDDPLKKVSSNAQMKKKRIRNRNKKKSM